MASGEGGGRGKAPPTLWDLDAKRGHRQATELLSFYASLTPTCLGDGVTNVLKVRGWTLCAKSLIGIEISSDMDTSRGRETYVQSCDVFFFPEVKVGNNEGRGN